MLDLTGAVLALNLLESQWHLIGT